MVLLRGAPPTPCSPCKRFSTYKQTPAHQNRETCFAPVTHVDRSWLCRYMLQGPSFGIVYLSGLVLRLHIGGSQFLCTVAGILGSCNSRRATDLKGLADMRHIQKHIFPESQRHVANRPTNPQSHFRRLPSSNSISWRNCVIAHGLQQHILKQSPNALPRMP